MSFTNDTSIEQLLDPEQLRRDIHILKSDLSGALATQPGLYFHYAELNVRARAQMDRFKARLDLVQSSLNKRYRKVLQDDLVARGETRAKVTIDQIDAAVKMDPTYVKMQSAVIAAESVFRLTEAAMFSFVQRKDMLVALARNEHPGAAGPRSAGVAGNDYLAIARQQREASTIEQQATSGAQA